MNLSKVIFFLIICLMVLGCYPLKEVASKNTRKISFVNNTKNDGTADKNRLTAILKIDTVQKKLSGLKFSIQITNNANVEVSIHNPIDEMTIQLLNDTGLNVLYPYIPGALINTTTPFKSDSFKIESLLINGKAANLEAIFERNLVFSAKGTYDCFFTVPYILKAGAVKPYTLDQTTPVTNGRYCLQIGLALAQEGTKPVRLNLSPVFINYGRERY